MKIIKISIFIVMYCATTFSQVVFQKLYSDEYAFLSRISQKGIIVFEDDMKPLSRKYIAEKLVELKNNDSLLTSLEKEELRFFLKDYYSEIYTNDSTEAPLVFCRNDEVGRIRFLSFNNELFKINISPILGFVAGSKSNNKKSHLWNGLGLYGYLSDWIGFSFDFRDNSENGDGIDRTKKFSSEQGALIIDKEKKIEYSKVQTSISFSWSWGNFSLAKDNLEIGYGESGKIILSQKAPTFPFIRLTIQPVDWFRFNYVHAWLNSDVIDSNETYKTSYPRQSYSERITYRNKYYAMHSFSFTPLKGLDIMLGESIIYSDKLEISYLMPLMFFRLADHYLSNLNNSAGGNSQFFFNVSSRNHFKNTHLFGSLFIDEITMEGLGDSKKERNQFGFTIGGSVVDFLTDNIEIKTEYTKIYPFVYTHYIQTQTYENSSYIMGHWIGHNADLLYGELNYRFIRGLKIKLWGELIRKGSEGVVEQQYTQPQPPFLFGLRTKYRFLGLDLKYQLIHELNFVFNYCSTKISKQQTDNSYDDYDYSEFSIGIYYGL